MHRHIAIMIDGGFLVKRLRKLTRNPEKLTPEKLCRITRGICRKHVHKLTGDADSDWHKHVYRIFFYDAPPFAGQAHHPLTGRQINFAKTDRARFQMELFQLLRKERNFALRLGSLSKIQNWFAPDVGKLLTIKSSLDTIAALPRAADGSIVIPGEQMEEFLGKYRKWQGLRDWEVQPDLKQKGVDMRIGLDMASIALKRLASTIILITGDADFVPAAKLARREGLQVILDPLWQNIGEDLFEHIDGLRTTMFKPRQQK